MPVRTPRLRILRRLGSELPGLTRKSPGQRSGPPGQHGAAGVRRRKSSFRRSLEEKQKVRFNYGITERQLRHYLDRARAMQGVTGANLLSLIERRLDNVVFRLGLAPTIPAARQLVSHGHVHVDGARVDRPGYEVAPGEAIALRSGSCSSDVTRVPAFLPSWLARVDGSATGRMLALPTRAGTGVEVDDALIIEFYTR